MRLQLRKQLGDPSCFRVLVLFLDNVDLRAWVSAASKGTFFDLFEAHDAIFCGVNREITADVGADTCDLGATSLADEYFACRDFLATKALYA